MELDTALLIDVGLNVIGYLAAGALSLVMYSIFRRNRRPATDTPAPAAEKTSTTTDAERQEPPVRERRTAGGMQYLNFSGRETEQPTEKPGSVTLRRNRAEVLRMARAMIQQGATDEQIKDNLPVSDAELAVLNYERK